MTVYKGNPVSASSLLSPIVFDFSACEVTWPYSSITYGDQAFFNGPLAKQKWSTFNCSIWLDSFSFSFSMSWHSLGFLPFLLLTYAPPSSSLRFDVWFYWELAHLPFSCSSSQFIRSCVLSLHISVFPQKTLYANIFLCHIFSNVFFLNLYDFIFNNKVIHTGKEHLRNISM